MSGLTASKMIMALALCLLLMSVLSVEAAGRINADCHKAGKCIDDGDCTRPCSYQGFSHGSCKILDLPSSKLHPKIIGVDYDMPGTCCCH
ncbi:hypothetical protein C5167_027266 [Papaver somniferum]|nr:hypothetical protein C5167_027266 [Papaver somniferum]